MLLWKSHHPQGETFTVWAYRFSAHDVTKIDNHVHVWGPGLKLPLPGGERGQRHHQEEWPVQLVLVKQVGQKGDGLNGLSQPHLIGQDNTVAPE